MEKFLLIFCVILSPSIMQGLLTKHKGTDKLVKKVIDRLIEQHGVKDTKKNIYTAVSEDIIKVEDSGGKDEIINGIQSFVVAKRLVHAGFGIVKRSTDNLGDIHARGTSTTPKPTTSTSTSTTPPTTMSPTTAAATITANTANAAKLTPFNVCKKFWKSCRQSDRTRGWPFKR